MSELEIKTLAPDQIKAASPLFTATKFKSYRFLTGNELNNFRLNELALIAADPHLTVFLAEIADRPAGIVSYADNPWESELFGKKMGVIKHLIVDSNASKQSDACGKLLRHVIAWASQRGIDGLLCKTHTDDILSIHELERQNFLLMDTLLDYVYDYRKHPFTSIPVPKPVIGNRIRIADENDREELTALANTAFEKHFGRYNADERISCAQASRVYGAWIEASFNGWADWILVAEINKQIAGFSIWKKPSQAEEKLGVKLGHYSIGAVHPAHHGKGVFGALTHEGMKLLEGKMDCLEGPTHINNYPVQQAYAKLGWRIADARHSFHRWLT